MKAQTNREFEIRVPLWANAPNWNLDEMCWLALGFDPKRVKRGSVPPELSGEQQDLLRDVQDVLDVHFDGGVTSRRPSPQKAMELLSFVGRNLPSQLAAAIDGNSVGANSGERPNAAITKEFQSLEKALLVLAVELYGPKDAKGAAGRISDAARGRGVSIDEATVRKYLKRALEKLDQTEKSALFGRLHSPKK